MHENVEPFWIFIIALMKITPEVLLFPKKRGGGIQLVPLPINESKQYTFGVKWVIKLLRDKNRIVTLSSLTDTLIQAIYNKGISIEKKESVYSISDTNRHLARFFR